MIEHSKDKLAKALMRAGLHEMSFRAATGYYHDFLSPLDFPDLQLDADLVAAGTPAAMEIRARHWRGEFDATSEESDTWAASPDGQAAFATLKGGK
jgi:hypothetical protein